MAAAILLAQRTWPEVRDLLRTNQVVLVPVGAFIMLILRNLELGDSLIDFALYRYDDNVSLQILRNDGGIEVSVSHLNV